MNIKLDIPAGFFEGEERCGYYVSPEMKKVWAVELDLLAEFARVCDKHNLRWHIAYGTLLGAVRHKGFIPWDDDVDVTMPLEDYERLRSVPPEEFAYPYCLQPEENWTTGRALQTQRLYNISTTMGHQRMKQCFESGNKLTIGYNAGIFIDIFPLNRLPNDDRELARLCKKILALSHPPARTLYDGLVRCTDDYMPTPKPWKRWIKAILHCLLSIVNPLLGGVKESLRKRLPERFEEFLRLINSFDDPDGERVGDLSSMTNISHFLKHEMWPLEDFADTTHLPFEMLTLPAPSGWADILERAYGDWHKYVVSINHANFYDTEKPYTYYVNTQTPG